MSLLAWKTVRAEIHGLKDSPKLGFAEWAPKFMENEDGTFFAFRPYQVQPANDMFDPAVKSLSLRWYSGAGKTYLFAAGIAYAIHQLKIEAGTMFPHEKLAESWLRKKLMPILAATPVLAKIGLRKDNVLEKVWKNGAWLRAVGSNSAGVIRTLEISLMNSEEIDAIKQDTGDEGDKLAAFEKRGRGRRDQFKWRSSYPSISGHSKIDQCIEQSDDRHWVSVCPRCDHEFEMLVEHIKWPKGEPEKAEMECPKCSRMLTDEERVQMSSGSKWVAMRSGGGNRGYHLNCMAHVGDFDDAYSNYLHAIAEEKESISKAKDKERAKRVFVNTMEAKSYKPPAADKPTAPFLLSRREDFRPEDMLPAGVLGLWAGTDVQKRWLDLTILGFGQRREIWLVARKKIQGSYKDADTWREWLAELKRPYEHPEFTPRTVLKPGCPVNAIVDCNHYKDEILGHIRGMGRMGIYGLETEKTLGKPIYNGEKKNPSPRAKLIRVGANEAKDYLFSNIALPEESEGAIHWPRVAWCGEDYFSELLGEEGKQDSSGLTRWVNVDGNRVEALDGFVYALAAERASDVDYGALAANLPRKTD